jgi:serine/threonine protein kinase
MTAPANVESFLRLTALSGLLPEEHLHPYLQNLEALAPVRNPSDLARQMIADGLLTNFHAEQLLAGKYRGFRLGKYLLLERIGTGGMGAVLLAVHVVLKRRVALKVLPPKSAADPGVLERFYREARAAALLDHPNIAIAHDVDCDGNLHFLVMEFVDGVDFQNLITRRGPLEPSHAAFYLRQAAEGLAHAHARGLVHRDIKPDNLMLNRQGVVKILDMGLARFFADDTDTLTMNMSSDSVLGTADYIAPEQAMDSHAVDIRADIYSLGGTLFFLLTGRPPYTGGGAAQKLLWHQMRPVEDVRSVRPGIPAGLAALVKQMMAKDPKERLQTPAEVSAALAEFAATEVSPPAPAELPQWCRAAEMGGGTIPPEMLLFNERQVNRVSPVAPPVTPPVNLLTAPVLAFTPTSVPEMPPENEAEPAPVLGQAVGPVTVLVSLAFLMVMGAVIWYFTSDSAAQEPKEARLEGEKLRILARSSNFGIGPQAMAVFKDGKWSGDAQLWASPPKAGEWCDLILPVAAKGRYRVTVTMTKAADYGTVQFWLDDKPVGQPFDGYIADKVVNAAPIDLGVVEVRKNYLTLRIDTVGTNPKSIGARYMWGLDCVVLQPEP